MSEAQSNQTRVREIIEDARRENSKTLNLSSYRLQTRLEKIPEEVFDFPQLEELELHGNNIREVPERIRDVSTLKRLDLSGNPVEKVPDIPGLEMDWDSYLRCRQTLSSGNVEGINVDTDNLTAGLRRLTAGLRRAGGIWLSHELARLTRLRSLTVYGPHFTGDDESLGPARELGELIDGLGQLHRLEYLDISGLRLGAVPGGIRNLRKLRRLALYGEGLRTLPDWLGELKHLQSLYLGGNQLKSLPESLADLPELEAINLDDNLFTEIPEVVFRMRNLKELNFWCSYDGLIKQVPPDILRLTKLERLILRGHPIEVPPQEVVNEGVEAIKNYWRQRQDVGVDYLAEAKLIILGEAGAGKTSLARKIQDRDYELRPGEESTEGIDVLRWSFPAAVRVQKEGREELHQTEFKVSIWDFGGQEIYHATHQFFLTRRSLYALVADDRKEDTDFNYWLQVVELLSDRSPLLIVQNEKQDRQRNMDIARLRADFPNLREAFRTNLATGRGLSEIERAIRQELERLPHIGAPLPKTWSQVRRALEDDARNYIGLEEYLRVCQENGFTRREDKLQLSGYLHDLGICLHFQDDEVLKYTVILKPKWGTDAVYRVLDDREILESRGRFGPEDLARIWSDEQYATMRGELLRLMMKFQLCYRLPNTEAYIAPQMLSAERPAYEWDARDGLVLRYDYEFMPKGILTRFIVAVNHLIEDQSLVWKSGVILAREGARAEVVEDYPRRKIHVRVSGADARGLLAIVDDQLERIHASFPRLKYDKYLPCNCEVCRTREEPFAYPLSELKDFAAQGDLIQCRVSRKLVDAWELIRDVLPSVALAFFVRNLPPTPREEIYSKPVTPPVKEVFVSYKWGGEGEAVVDKLQEAFEGRDVVLVRDKSEMKYKDSIRDFMRRVGRGKCVVVVLSKGYLESQNCMFELIEIAKHKDVRDRVFPVVLEDADIYNARGRLKYIKYWEREKKELNDDLREVGGEYVGGVREDLELFTDIRNTIDGIVDILRDMNALTPEQHRGENFGALLEALEERLSE